VLTGEEEHAVDLDADHTFMRVRPSLSGSTVASARIVWSIQCRAVVISEVAGDDGALDSMAVTMCAMVPVTTAATVSPAPETTRTLTG
jgi:hypothetical protein